VSPAEGAQLQDVVRALVVSAVLIGAYVGYLVGEGVRLPIVRRWWCSVRGHDWLHEDDPADGSWCVRCHRVEHDQVQP
jgi:hypothetical protein